MVTIIFPVYLNTGQHLPVIVPYSLFSTLYRFTATDREGIPGTKRSRRGGEERGEHECADTDGRGGSGRYAKGRSGDDVKT